MATPSEADPLIGRVLGEFVLREQIGLGGFGAVYRAEQAQLGREAVVKVLRPRHQGKHDLMTRFIREARLASGLEHPYAAHVYACGEDDGLLWIAMELVRGTPFSALLKQRTKIPPAELVPFLEKVCEVLQTAHELGIVHRDIKPANVMVVVRAGRWLPKLLDFGIARAAAPIRIGMQDRPAWSPADLDDETIEDDPIAPVTVAMPVIGQPKTVPMAAATTPMQAVEPRAPLALTQTGSVLGSPTYMAPEQWRTPSEVDGRADIYALGAVAFQALTGAVPFKAESMVALYDAHRTAAVPALPDEFPRALDAAIGKALAKQPGDRYATAMDFAAALRDAIATVPVARPPSHDGIVYPGLRAFTADEAVGFYGREREAEAVRSRLITEPVIAVVGPSGSGKSSFVQAGIVAELPPDWRTVTLRPGADPPRALTSALHSVKLGRGESLLVVVDQLEELFTQCVDPAFRVLFAETLIAMATATDRRVRVVVTLRDDFLVRTERLPPLRNRLGRAIQILATPGRDELTQILVEPARRSGYEFEDRELVEEVVDAVAGTDGGLALLAFTAARLWERRDRERRTLTRAAYHAIGGVGGALAKHADAILATLSGAQRMIAREAFRRLVMTGGTRATFGRGELADALGGSEDADLVIERLVDARLLIASEGDDGARVEIAHEVLVTAWPQLTQWRFEDAEEARMLEQLRSAAGQWKQRGHAKGLLWRDDALAELSLWRTRHPRVVLSALEREFADACLREGSRARRRMRIGVALGALASAAVIVVLWRATVRARSSAENAHGLIVDAWQEYGRRELLAGRTINGVAWLSAARREGATGPGLQFLLNQGAEVLAHHGHRIVHGRPVQSVDIASGGAVAVSGSEDGVAIVWEPGTGRVVHRLDHGGPITSVALSPNALLVLTAGAEGSKVWDARDGKLVWASPDRGQVLTARFIDDDRVIAEVSGEIAIYRFRGAAVIRILAFPGTDPKLALAPSRRWIVGYDEHALVTTWDVDTGQPGTPFFTPPNTAVFAISPDSALIAAGFNDNRARIWTATGELRHELIGHTKPITCTAFSPDGSRLLTTSSDHTAKLWDVATGELMFTIEDREQIKGGVFTRDGTELVTYGGDAAIRLWDVRDGTPLVSLDGHDAPALAIAVSDSMLVTGGWDGTARSWHLGVSPLVASIATRSNPSGVRQWAAQFSPDSKMVVTSDAEGRVLLWEIASGRLIRAFDGPKGEVYGVAFSPTGDRIAIASTDRSAWVFRVGDSVKLARMVGHAERVWSVAFSPDGARLVTSSWDHTAAIWDAATGTRLHVLGDHTAVVWQAGFSPDGRSVVTASDDATARIWNADTGKVVRVISGHAAGLSSAAFSPDGTRLVTGSRDLTARIWDVASGRQLARLEGHSNWLNETTFSPDNAQVLTAGFDGSVRIWDASSGALLREIAAHRSAVNIAEASADGQLLVTAGSFDDRVKVWRLSPSIDVQRVIECKTTLEVVDGRLEPRRPPDECASQSAASAASSLGSGSTSSIP